MATEFSDERQLQIFWLVLLALDKRAHGLTDHPGNRYIIAAGERANVGIIPFIEADGNTSLLAFTLGSCHE